MKGFMTAFLTCVFLILAVSVPGFSEVTVGTYGVLEKRLNDDLAVVPEVYGLITNNFFPSDTLSFYGDISGRTGWDGAEDIIRYDASGLTGFSLRSDSLYVGLAFSGRIREDDLTSREADGRVSGNFSYNDLNYSLFLKPWFGGVDGASDSIFFGIEPGIDVLISNSWVGTLSLASEITSYEDGGRSVSIAPRLLLDWYPEIPLSLGLKGGWTGYYDSDGSAVSDLVQGEVDFLLYPSGWFSVDVKLPFEREYYRDSGDVELRIMPAFRMMKTLFADSADVDFVLEAGAEILAGDGSFFFVRIGVEKDF